MTLAQPVDRRGAAGAGGRQIQKQRQQFVGAAPVRPPAQFIVDEPADDVLIAAALGAEFARPAADMNVEFRIEDVGEILFAARSGCRSFFCQANDMPRSRLGVTASGEGPAARNRFVGPGAERVEAPAREPAGDRHSPRVSLPYFRRHASA